MIAADAAAGSGKLSIRLGAAQEGLFLPLCSPIDTVVHPRDLQYFKICTKSESSDIHASNGAAVIVVLPLVVLELY